MARRWATAAAALALVLAGCSAEPPALPDGVTVSLVQLRSDVADRQAQVRVRNGTDAEILLGGVTFHDPRWSGPAGRVVDRTSTLAPGARVDVRVQLGEVDCAAGDEGDPTVELFYESEGRAGSARVVAAEEFPFLAALHRRECTEARARAALDIGFGGFEPSVPGVPAALVVEVAASRADAGVAVRGIRETNLLTFDGRDRYPLTLGATTVPLVPARCDAHAVQEDKRGTVFGVVVEIDGTEASFDLAADPDLRGRLLTWVADWCGYAG